MSSFLHHDLTPEEQQIRDVTRQFVINELRPHERRVEEQDSFDRDLADELRAKAVAAGLYAYNMPADVGGPGLGVLAQVLIREQLGHVSMPLADVLGRPPRVLLACNEAQRKDYLLAAVEGKRTWAFALTEPGAGSDATALSTRAVPDGDGYRITGRKQYISNGDHADFVIVFAQVPDAGVTAFLVDRGTEGFSVGRIEPKMGWKGYQVAELVFEDCYVPACNVLGEVGGGFKLAMEQINEARLGVAAHCVGMAQRAYDLAVEHITNRVQFGQPVSEFQGVRWMVADMLVDIERHRAMLYAAARTVERGDRRQARVAVSMIKLAASEMVCRVADTALQLFGGAGYMADTPIEMIYRDARAFRIGEGTSEIQRNQISREALRR